MQSGAFIQLALTLAAVAARTMALLPEIQDALQVSWAAGHTILQVLDVSAKSTLGVLLAHSVYSMVFLKERNRKCLVLPLKLKQSSRASLRPMKSIQMKTKGALYHGRPNLGPVMLPVCQN